MPSRQKVAKKETCIFLFSKCSILKSAKRLVASMYESVQRGANQPRGRRALVGRTPASRLSRGDVVRHRCSSDVSNHPPGMSGSVVKSMPRSMRSEARTSPWPSALHLQQAAFLQRIRSARGAGSLHSTPRIACHTSRAAGSSCASYGQVKPLVRVERSTEWPS